MEKEKLKKQTNFNTQKLKNNKAITLIALVVTIVVLLILAGISISLVMGDNGIIKKARDARVQTEISEEKEILNIAVSTAIANKKGETSLITTAELQSELDNLTGRDKTKVSGGGILNVLFVESNREYEVKNTGESEMVETIKTTDKTPGILDGSGDKVSPYLIESIEDLVAFSKSVEEGNNYDGKYIKLTITLDFNSTKSYIDANKKYEEFGDLNGTNGVETILEEMTSRDGRGFTPIGVTNNFKGSFDGNNNCIRNLYVNSDSLDYSGFFSKAQNAVIENLSVSGEVYGKNVAGIAGYIYEGTIKNCNNYVKLSGKEKVYGIAGSYIYTGNMIIEDCNNYADINCEAKDCYGIGYSGTIENCNNYGNISSKYRASLNGICDMGNIRECNNHGNIKIITDADKPGYAAGHVNGISGVHGKAYKCNNYGNLYVEVKNGEKSTSSEVNASGIGSGYARNCVNYGDITTIGGEIHLGGIIGEISSTSFSTSKPGLYIENCCNFGTMNSKMNVLNYWSGMDCGGIIGDTACNINIYNNINFGEINIESNIEKWSSVGGIAGFFSHTSGGSTLEGSYTTYPSIKNCINVGKINILKNIGKIKVGGVYGNCVSTQSLEGNLYNIADIYILGEMSGEKDEITIEQIKNILNTYVREQNSNIEDESLRLYEWKIKNINNKDVLTIETSN